MQFERKIIEVGGSMMLTVPSDLAKFLENDVNLNNTVVFFISDHGLHTGIW